MSLPRRSFLKTLGLGAVAAAVPTCGICEAVPAPATIGQYADYISFSSFTLTQAMDEIVSKAAAELGDSFKALPRKALRAFDPPLTHPFTVF